MAANISWASGHEMEMPFSRTPFDEHSWNNKSYPRIFPGLFCFGGLIFLLLLVGLGVLNRRWIYRKHGPSDPWHFWAPPPHHEEKTPRDSSPKSSPDDIE
jgi:hypothetical protein